MSDCIEVLFISDNSGRIQTANCINPHNGTTLMTYRGGGGATKRCLSVIGNDYLISADTSKPILHVWPLNSQEPTHNLRNVVAGKPTSLAVSPDGYYCVAGIDGKIYVWMISSGVLLKVVAKHFQAINKIVFMDDSSHFITAGDDGLVLVWKLADVVAKQFGDIFKLNIPEPQPLYNFSHHSLPVTDVYIGKGSLRARLFTVSTDRTCKIFCMSTGELIVSIVFDYSLTSVTVNELETELFVGASRGEIQIFNLDPFPVDLEHHIPEESTFSNIFTAHSKAVTCLSLSLDGITLASGSNDEKVYLWNIPGKQVLRSFEMKGPISNLFFHSASHNIFSNKFNPQLVLNKFEKVNNPDEKGIEINVIVQEDLTPFLPEENLEYLKERVFDSENSKTDDESDVTALKQEISKLKKVNKELYQFAMNKILSSPLSIGMMNENNSKSGDE